MPDEIANAIASGNATSPTVMPAIRSETNVRVEYCRRAPTRAGRKVCLSVIGPQPGGTAYAARVAMGGPHEPGTDDFVDTCREDPPAPESRHAFVERLDIRQAAANHDDIRIEHVDDRGQPARGARQIPVHGQRGCRIARRGECADLWRLLPCPRAPLVIGREALSGEVRFD